MYVSQLFTHMFCLYGLIAYHRFRSWPGVQRRCSMPPTHHPPHLCPTGSAQRERIDRPSTWSEDLGVIDNSSQAIHRLAVLALPLSQTFNLIFTFPLLKDLVLNAYDGTSADNSDGSGRDEIPTTTQPLTPPTFTGSLDLSLWGEMKLFTRRLLSLVGGIHFRKLTVRWYRGDTHVLGPY